jgi:hypothetical protein
VTMWTWFRQKSSGSFITGRNRGMTPTTITSRPRRQIEFAHPSPSPPAAYQKSLNQTIPPTPLPNPASFVIATAQKDSAESGRLASNSICLRGRDDPSDSGTGDQEASRDRSEKNAGHGSFPDYPLDFARHHPPQARRDYVDRSFIAHLVPSAP